MSVSCLIYMVAVLYNDVFPSCSWADFPNCSSQQLNPGQILTHYLRINLKQGACFLGFFCFVLFCFFFVLLFLPGLASRDALRYLGGHVGSLTTRRMQSRLSRPPWRCSRWLSRLCQPDPPLHVLPFPAVSEVPPFRTPTLHAAHSWLSLISKVWMTKPA